MFIDFSHNKIISETISEAFKRNFEEKLVPRLQEHYPTLLGVQMYEDYISDKFLKDGYWYYPLTLMFDERQRSLWIKWRMSRSAFADGNPYAYTAETPLAFDIADVVPDEFRNAISGRAIYCEEGLIPVIIDAQGQDPVFLSGKYSQTFVDEMARQLTREIAASQGVLSLIGSHIELRLVFAPDTFMEHTAECVTYRRLLITDKGCAPRDFWVKWTRLDGAVGYTVSDSPAKDSITFEIGEDVSQKIREREYRFLMRNDPDKLHSAMSRKNVTEWREILRRAIRRGDLIKAEEDTVLTAERDMELRRQLSEVLGVSSAPASEPVKEPDVSEEDELVRLAREAIMGASRMEEPEVTVAVPAPEKKKKAAEPKNDLEQIAISLFDALPEKKEEENAQSAEDRIRAEIEAKLRLEYESRARAAAEEEAARLREENERLLEKARLEEEQKARDEARFKAEIEAKLRAEERERERLAEAARIAMQEKRRLEEERAAEELRRKQEEARLLEQKRRREEEERLAVERRAAEEKRRLEEERIRIEREKAEQLARELAEKNAPKYISRTAEFTFRRTVDPNVTKRIYEIVKATIEFYHKEDVYIRIKASVPDTSTVRLEFLEIPEEEGELVVNIIKALGKSDLGIAKATLN